MKHPKLIKALNFLEMEQEERDNKIDEFLKCNKCRGGGDLSGAIDYHMRNCVKPVTNSTKE